MMDASAQIAQAKADARKGAADLLKTFSFVPDDKLTFAPSETSRHALWLVGHCAHANFAFAGGIRGDEMQAPADPAEFSKMVWVAGKETSSREEAVRLLNESTDQLVAALDALTPEGLEGFVSLPFAKMPMSFWITFSGMHMDGHARQVDYLQTIWGDLIDHNMG